MTLPLFKELTAPNGKKFNQPLGIYFDFASFITADFN